MTLQSKEGKARPSNSCIQPPLTGRRLALQCMHIFIQAPTSHQHQRLTVTLVSSSGCFFWYYTERFFRSVLFAVCLHSSCVTCLSKAGTGCIAIIFERKQVCPLLLFSSFSANLYCCQRKSALSHSQCLCIEQQHQSILYSLLIPSFLFGLKQKNLSLTHVYTYSTCKKEVS